LAEFFGVVPIADDLGEIGRLQSLINAFGQQQGEARHICGKHNFPTPERFLRRLAGHYCRSYNQL
jgi:hypothetical protein